jgi:tetratricopeptide (TPR) repeat protein
MALVIVKVLAGPGSGPTVYAVGRIQDYTGDQVATAIADMLTTSLARVSGLAVVSTARMYELTRGDTAQVLAAARRARAGVLLDGTLFKAPAGGYRLSLRSTAVDDGRVLRADGIEGADLFALVDSATAAVARASGAGTPVAPLATQTTASLAAYRLYSEGLRAYHLGNTGAARALLDAAVVEDSTFALAWLWAARANLGTYREWRRRIDRAVALAPRAPERERLLILSDFATHNDAPARLALAETLATRFPTDAEAQLQFGIALQWDGQFLAAVDAFDRALELDQDGLASARPGERCLACEAVSGRAQALRLVDSAEASVNTARRWPREAPNSADAWHTLADAFMYAGRAEDGYAAERLAAPLDTRDDPSLLPPLIALHAAEDWDAGERFFGNDMERPERGYRQRGLWWMIIIRRNQGRLNEALALTGRYIEEGGNSLPRAQVRFERGEYAAAARDFRAIAGAPPREQPLSRQARETAWYLTHTATALAAAGDTSSLLELADSVEALGRLTAYGRDRRLHHHIRGLLFAARGRRDEAIESFQRAVFSLAGGYTRSNYELGRLLLEAGRPIDAVRALRPILHGSLEASNYYLTRTEVHELLGRAFEAAGQADSAVAHYRRAIASWRSADPPVVPRREAMERRVEALARRSR